MRGSAKFYGVVIKMVEIKGKKQFEDIKLNGGIVLAEFYSSNCPHCLTMDRIIRKICEDSDHNGKYSVAKINTADNPELCKEYNIKAVPTMIVMKNGELAARHTGLMRADELENIMTH